MSSLQKNEMRFRTLPLLASIFGTLLALIIFTSVCVFFVGAKLQDRLTAAELRYHGAANLLIAVRSDIYASMSTIQQYLLDPSTGRRRAALEELSRIEQSSHQHLAELHVRFAGDPQMDRLREGLDLHWAYLNQSLMSTTETQSTAGRLSKGSAALSDALAITREMDEINASNLNQERVELEGHRHSFRYFLLWLTLLTVGLGLIVSIASLVSLRRLEGEREEQRQRRERAEFELRRLSQQLLQAQEEERKNISRELHDEVGQLLTGLRIELGNLQRSNSDPAVFEARIQEAKALAEKTLRTIRNLAMLLRPSMLDDQGLAPALRWLAKEFSRRFDIPVAVQIEGDVENVPSGHGVCLYRVIQEVLTNCAKHAQAKHIGIAVNANKSAVSALIEDDGVGFKTQSRDRTDGIGLLGVAERVRELRGTFFIDSEPGRGTRIDVQLPINQGQSNE